MSNLHNDGCCVNPDSLNFEKRDQYEGRAEKATRVAQHGRQHRRVSTSLFHPLVPRIIL